MIEFSEIEFKRVVVHKIDRKEKGQEHASVDPDNHLIIINNDVQELIKDRLVKAAMKTGKALELSIEQSANYSFYGICSGLNLKNDTDFMESSTNLAHLLAEAQTRNSIPGGYLIFIEALTPALQKVYIVIKAELQEVLKYEWNTNASYVKLLSDVFLSTDQKFYKVGVIFERKESEWNIDLESPNDKWACFLFDNQFNPDSKPAEYFYSDFLGFSIESNPKIQTKKFYDSTESFVTENVDEYTDKQNIISALKQEMHNKDTRDISPKDFSESYFHDEELTEKYVAEVANYLPEYVLKDPEMIKSKLEWRKINFPNKVTLSAPDRHFDFNIQIITSKKDLDTIDPEDDNVTIVKIIGKPYQKD